MQTEKFLQELKRVYPDEEFELNIIKTLGDTEKNKPLFAIDSQGIFQKEIDQALVDGEADFAVASLKDVPTVQVAATVVAAIPKRASVQDVLISKDKIPLKLLRKGAVIGTGSLRRLSTVKHVRPDLDVQPIRGNVDTRISKVKKGVVDGVIVAEAGLERMELTDHITERLPLEQFPSAPGQGALAIVTRKGDNKTIDFLKAVDHRKTRAEVTAERQLMFSLGGGCRVPIGSVGKAEGDILTLRGVLFELDGQGKIEAQAQSTIGKAEELGKQVAEKLVALGAKDIEAKWREKYGSW
jgi:hydroxymethylbilane synthase